MVIWLADCANERCFSALATRKTYLAQVNTPYLEEITVESIDLEGAYAYASTCRIVRDSEGILSDGDLLESAHIWIADINIRTDRQADEDEDEDDTYTCADCGDTEDANSDEFHNLNHERICESCDEDYGSCNRCAERFSTDDLTYWDGRRHEGDYCRECLDVYTFECADCDDRVSRHGDYGSNAEGESVCSSCAENYFYCDSCNETYRTSEYGSDGRCGSCSREDEDEENESSSSLIRSYGYKPTPRFHGESSDIHYGVELEVNTEKLSPHAKHTMDALGSAHAYLKSDSSIGSGFEIVTHPHTLQAHRDAWKAFFDDVPAGMTSYKSGKCGMHVHIERSKLSQMQIRRMLVFVNAPANRGYIHAIAQRSENTYCEIKEKKLTDSFSCDRYEALNVTNEHTIELRIFRGSVRADRFFKNLEFTDAMVRFCAITTYAQLTVRAFLDFVSKRKSMYKYLHNYHVERGLIHGKPLPVNGSRQRTLINIASDTAA